MRGQDLFRVSIKVMIKSETTSKEKRMQSLYTSRFQVYQSMAATRVTTPTSPIADLDARAPAAEVLVLLVDVAESELLTCPPEPRMANPTAGVPLKRKAE